MVVIVWITVQKGQNLKAETSFHSKVTCSVLSVSALSASSLLHNVFFTAWDHDVWHGSAMACRKSNEGRGGGSLRRVNWNPIKFIKWERQNKSHEIQCLQICYKLHSCVVWNSNRISGNLFQSDRSDWILCGFFTFSHHVKHKHGRHKCRTLECVALFRALLV